MPSSTVNICVLTLVLLSFQQICHCRPNRSKRGLVKDYFVPDTLIFASDKFEKGEDGKYHLKKTAHRQDSEVNYISADNAERKNNIVPDHSEVESNKDDSKTAEAPNTKTDQYIKEQPEKGAELIPSSEIVKETKKIDEKIDIKDQKAPFTPNDSKFMAPTKPDAKDEVALKADLPPTESEVKEEEKISIGQVPDLSSPLVPAPETFRIPILIPIRQISYRAMKIIPVPPADVSDRLPVPYEDDIVGEGAHESESEEVSQPLAEKESGYHLGNPLMSLLSFHDLLKNLKEADKGDVEKESKVVDVLGKKLLMQSNVMKYPTSENGRVFIRFLSVKPLDEVNPAEPKIVAAEETLKKELETGDGKEIEMRKEEDIVKEKDTVNKEKDTDEYEMKKESEEKLMKEDDILQADESEEKLKKEAEILKAEETELKMKFEKNVPKEVILKNVGKEETDDKMESVAKEVKSIEEIMKETDMHKMPQPEIKDVDLDPIMESKEITEMGKAESQLADEKMKDESKSVDVDTQKRVIKDEKGNIKKTEAADTFVKKHEEKKTDMESKKDFFLVEKKKKEKSMEESEGIKQKKKNEKKKKKCKCEEKDSDSDDDIDK